MSNICWSCKLLREEIFLAKCGHYFCKKCIAVSYVTENQLCTASHDKSIDLEISNSLPSEISQSGTYQTEKEVAKTPTTDIEHIEKEAGQGAAIALLVDSEFHFSYAWEIEDFSEIKTKGFRSSSFDMNKFKNVHLRLVINKARDDVHRNTDISCQLKLSKENFKIINWPNGYSATLTLLDRYSGKDVSIAGKLEEKNDPGSFFFNWRESEIGYKFSIPISQLQPPYLMDDTIWLKSEIIRPKFGL